MINEKSTLRTASLLEEHAGARDELRTLVNEGCDRNELIAILELAFLANDSWKSLVDMDLRAFKRVVSQIKDCAVRIDRLDHSSLIHDLSLEWHHPLFVGLRQSPTLPERLREYASLIDSLRSVFGPRQSFHTDNWRAWIVARVLEDTKDPRDAEVSCLISAVLSERRRKPYDVKAHQAWRRKHRDRIAMMADIQEKHRKAAPLASPPKPPST